MTITTTEIARLCGKSPQTVREIEHIWLVEMVTIVGTPSLTLPYQAWVQIDRTSGQLCLQPGGSLSAQVVMSPWFKQMAGDEANADVFTQIDITMQLLMILGCKNITTRAAETDPKQTRRAEKRFGPSATGYRYHTLVVRPPGAKSDSPGIDIGSMPRHVCRGHFSEYGPEFGKGLLFGKYAGRFYIPPHLKGDVKNGTVEKDYQIPAQAGGASA